MTPRPDLAGRRIRGGAKGRVRRRKSKASPACQRHAAGALPPAQPSLSPTTRAGLCVGREPSRPAPPGGARPFPARASSPCRAPARPARAARPRSPRSARVAFQPVRPVRPTGHPRTSSATLASVDSPATAEYFTATCCGSRAPARRTVAAGARPPGSGSPPPPPPTRPDPGDLSPWAERPKPRLKAQRV